MPTKTKKQEVEWRYLFMIKFLEEFFDETGAAAWKEYLKHQS